MNDDYRYGRRCGNQEPTVPAATEPAQANTPRIIVLRGFYVVAGCGHRYRPRSKLGQRRRLDLPVSGNRPRQARSAAFDQTKYSVPTAGGSSACSAHFFEDLGREGNGETQLEETTAPEEEPTEATEEPTEEPRNIPRKWNTLPTEPVPEEVQESEPEEVIPEETEEIPAEPEDERFPGHTLEEYGDIM